ncbi:hypothetical protein PHLGIDRAFT_416813 [Phlebiopsis gigantea 11061_1 CR5-6]|uniref:SET domain-containing protein n=1 Tax=Phlebiopsis gigantea (strain 11061_1 CR5-6) TaxID=745531 RepID=A0A0C3SFB9_PHLG1|nr:hypothetical protein PHLGIDRAFT_416813 [Phlebiopsis gigantea 11061_1 CR5-6]
MHDWECNAELCGHLSTLILNNDGLLCHNRDMQSNTLGPFEIKSGSFGLGAYAIEEIAKNTFIGEYTCEIYDSSTIELHSPYQKHSKYNYAFDLVDKSLIGDALSVGNGTRYINHSSAEINIKPRIKLVNAEHKIAFYSTRKIARGEELLFDYGKDYWKGQEL